MNDDNYFSYSINTEEECVEITESGETMKIDFSNFEDFAQCIADANTEFILKTKDSYYDPV
jgi:hypothetical protein